MLLLKTIIYLLFVSFVVGDVSECDDKEILLNSMAPMIMNLEANNITESINSLHVITMYQDILLSYYVECNYTQAISCNDTIEYLELLNRNIIPYRRYDWNNNLQIIIKTLLLNIIKLENNSCSNSNFPTTETCKYIRYDLLFKAHNIKIKGQMHGLSIRKVLNDINIFIGFIYDLVKYYFECTPENTIFNCKRNLQMLNNINWSIVEDANYTISKLNIIRYNLLRTIHSFEYDNICNTTSV